MEALEAVALRRFEERMVALVKERLPKHHAALGYLGMQDAIRYGIQRAALRGFRAEPWVEKFIVLMFVFGPDFDVDPAHPWAREALASGEGADEAERSGRLTSAATAELRRRAGVAS